ncbi:hypothetical protein DPEC_G00359030 [Dallia pectoralis]|uniref:Uncharacterized protein n=1 Tax=Dallia pectoralis TaxID=75939 RepID=A0ACC2F0D0_DALPE|nr:hypothetical protein DPEC_G00359030 [Dallia pectoralis]
MAAYALSANSDRRPSKRVCCEVNVTPLGTQPVFPPTETAPQNPGPCVRRSAVRGRDIRYCTAYRRPDGAGGSGKWPFEGSAGAHFCGFESEEHAGTNKDAHA